MGQVTLELSGRTYRLRCEDGDEKRLLQLGSILSKKIDSLKNDIGNVGDERLFVMASLMIVDEMLDLRKEVRELKKQIKTGLISEQTLQNLQAEDQHTENQIEADEIKADDDITSDENHLPETEQPEAEHTEQTPENEPISQTAENSVLKSCDNDPLSQPDDGNADQDQQQNQDDQTQPLKTNLSPLPVGAMLMNSPLLNSKLASSSSKTLQVVRNTFPLHPHEIKTGAEIARELKEKFLKEQD